MLLIIGKQKVQNLNKSLRFFRDKKAKIKQYNNSQNFSLSFSWNYHDQKTK